MSIPGAASPLFLAATAAGPAAGFEISRSLRFNSADSAYLSRTPSATGNRRTWTWSNWLKKSKVGSEQFLLRSDVGGGNARDAIRFEGTDKLRVFFNGTSGGDLITDQFFKDPGAFFHLVVAVDTTQSTSTDRVKIYVNGIQVTDFSTLTYPTQNYDTGTFVSGKNITIGNDQNSNYLNGSLAEVNFVDGAQLDATSFGAFDDNGVWQGIDTSGLSFGTNGFRLQFADNSGATATTLGKDTSGNSNNFTPNNLSVQDYVQYTYSTTRVDTPAGAWNGSTSGNAAYSTDISQYSGYFNLSIANVSTFEYYTNEDAGWSVKLNGGSAQSMSGSVGWHSVPNPPSTLTSFEWKPSDGSGNLFAFRVNGTILQNDSGAGNDSLRDSPGNGTASSGGDAGGVTVGNYATLNPLARIRSTNAGVGEIANLSNGNLTCTGVTNKYGHATSTIAIPSSGKYYFEVTSEATSDYINIGIASTVGTITGVFETSTDSHAAWYDSEGKIKTKVPSGGSVTVATVTQYRTTGGTIGVAVDVTNQEIKFYLDGTLKSTLSSLPAALISKLTAGEMFAYITAYNSAVGHINFGQRTFHTAAPAGFLALCTSNLPTPTIADGSKYFEAKKYNGGISSVTNLAFSPDFVWLKSRNVNTTHELFDTVRGHSKVLYSNQTGSEDSPSSALTGFTSDGFTLGGDSNVNNGGKTYISWNWDAGTSTVTNNDGSIASQVRAQPSAGFSIVSYTGNNTDNVTIGHQLNAVPEYIIVKNRDTADDWFVYSLPTAGNILKLNSTEAKGSSSHFRTMSSSTFQLSGNPDVNANGDNFIAYCFAPVAGYSAVGSYTGNGSSSDGTFIFTGFQPAFVMGKRIDGGSDNWFMNDASRLGYNPANLRLYPNLFNGEGSTTDVNMDMLSNGFKLYTTNTNSNGDGAIYVYLAFASNPIQANGGLAR